MTTTPEITTDELAAAMEQEGHLLLDVREDGEYDEAHVPGARSVPTGELANRLHEIPREANVSVICASGNRSRGATDFLNGAGFAAVSVAGGTKDWIRSGRPVESNA